MLDFREIDNGDKKTKRWDVHSGGAWLGDVKWFGRWRNYCYFPAPDVVMDKSCLREVADFCESESKAFRRTWGKAKQPSN